MSYEAMTFEGRNERAPWEVLDDYKRDCDQCRNETNDYMGSFLLYK